jgi:hypothetical protein
MTGRTSGARRTVVESGGHRVGGVSFSIGGVNETETCVPARRTAGSPEAILGSALRGHAIDALATCVGNKPGPEPGRTVLQLCVPRLVRAWVDNGLVAVRRRVGGNRSRWGG